jgi:5-formyltetrahydrofolate cyclo-ligase
VTTSKQELRQRLRATRDQVPAAWRGVMSHAAASRALLPLQKRQVVAVYSAIRSELDPAPLVELLRSQGVTIVYPRILDTTPVLEFCRVDRAEHLQAGHMGILEPAPDAACVALTDIDAFVIPALAFDPDGTRLGWGKGHYDHTLAQTLRALRVGLCFQEQIESSLPCEPTDQSMDWVVTDAKIYQGPDRPGLEGYGTQRPKEQ